MSTAPISVTSAPSNDKQRLCRHISIKPEHKPIKQDHCKYCTLCGHAEMHAFQNEQDIWHWDHASIVLECKQIKVVTSFESTSVVLITGLLRGPWSIPARPGPLLQGGPSPYIKYFAHP